MAEMTRRERIMAATRKEQADKLPFFHYWRHSQIGWAERQCRNRGMGMNWVRPPFTVKLHGVEIQETQAAIAGEVIIRRTYSTPVGRVYEDEKREPGVGQWHANRSWNDVLPWQTERLIKKPEDYKVLKYIVAHTEYIADYFPIERPVELNSYRVDRIMYGSDFPNIPYAWDRELKWLSGSGLPQEHLEWILGKSAADFFSLG